MVYSSFTLYVKVYPTFYFNSRVGLLLTISINNLYSNCEPHACQLDIIIQYSSTVYKDYEG